MAVPHSISALGLASALFTSVGVSGCSQAEAAPKAEEVPRISVTTTRVEKRLVPKFLTVTGTLLGNRESEVASDVAGKVVEAGVERGAVVTKGALLARLDTRSARLSQREYAAQVAAASVEKETAALECARAERLFRVNAISQAELDRARASCRSSDHSARALSARKAKADQELTDASIRAPFAGMIVERAVDVGEYVTVGRRIASVVELDPLRLELTVPEVASTSVHPGSPVEFRLRAFPDERFTGTIRYVGPVLRRATRDLAVEALVDNGERRLVPGMFAEAELRVGEELLPVVPKSALRGAPASPRVFVVAKDVIEERVVLTGMSDGDAIVIKRGLTPGEDVVSAPTDSVVDGARVK